jgi:hypothetical protein
VPQAGYTTGDIDGLVWLPRTRLSGGRV